jgi:hypothetical protein
MNRPSFAWRGGHLAVLWGFAIVQPLLDLLGSTPEFFVARGNGRGDIILLAFALALLPPAVMLGLEWLAGRLRGDWGWRLHLVFVAGLVALFALQIAKDLAAGPAALLVIAAAAVGVLGAWAYARTAFAPTALSYLTPAPAIFVALFLLTSGASELVLPQEEEAVAREVDPKTDAPVVMLIFDELPGSSLMSSPGRIDAERYPNFARLAGRSTWFPYATTVADGTTEAIPALLSGEMPEEDSVPNVGDYPDNLFTLLGDSYRLNVTEDATELCPARLCGGRELEPFGRRMLSLTEDLGVVSGHIALPDALREPLPPVDQSFEDFRGGGAGEGSDAEVSHGLQTRDGALGPFLEQIGSQPRTLHFLHLLVPHFPWESLPGGQRYPLNLEQFADGFMDTAGRWYEKPWLVRHGLQRHLLQVGYTDWVLGEVIDRLERAGVWDEALVVVAGDHGAAFVPGDYRRQVSDANYPELASVPILVKAPGQKRGAVDERPIETIDVLPTIAEELGIEMPFETDGVPVSEVPESRRVSLAHDQDEPVSAPFADFRREVGELIDRNARLFGSDWQGLYEWGPGSELVGERLARLEAGPVSGAELELVEPEAYADVDPGAPLIPALVKGTIRSGAEVGDPLAIAVNGRIVAGGEAYEAFGATRVIAAIPPESLRPGANEVEVLVVEGRRLRSLGGT